MFQNSDDRVTAVNEGVKDMSVTYKQEAQISLTNCAMHVEVLLSYSTTHSLCLLSITHTSLT